MREVKLCGKNEKNAQMDDDLGPAVVVNEGSGAELSVVLKYPRKMVYQINSENDFKKLNACGYVFENNQASVGDKILIKKEYNSYHTVKPCENLQSISHKYGLTEEKLININNLKSKKLFIGQILCIKD